MVREYIGARYVPKFMGTYDNTQEYEALCVVDNGLGTSYITKVPTPAGTPLTNTTYWAVYGATSGAILNLQNQIDDIKSDYLTDTYVTPEMYGAVGDGITDDVTAIQTAIDTNKPVLFRNNYYISTPLELHNDSILVGEPIFSYDGLTPKITTMTGALTLRLAARDILVKGLIFEARGNNEKFFDYDTTVSNRNIHFEDLLINGYAYGFYVNGVLWDSSFKNVRIKASNDGSDYAFYFSSSNSFNLIFEGVYIDGGVAEFNGVSALLMGCNFALHYDNQIRIVGNCNMSFISCNFECEVAMTTECPVKISGGVSDFNSCEFVVWGVTPAHMLESHTAATRGINITSCKKTLKKASTTMTVLPDSSGYMQGGFPYFLKVDDPNVAYDEYTGFSNGYLQFSPALNGTIAKSKNGATGFMRSMLRYDIDNAQVEYTPDGTNWVDTNGNNITESTVVKIGGGLYLERGRTEVTAGVATIPFTRTSDNNPILVISQPRRTSGIMSIRVNSVGSSGASINVYKWNGSDFVDNDNTVYIDWVKIST